jgi:hypothetical protein
LLKEVRDDDWPHGGEFGLCKYLPPPPPPSNPQLRPLLSRTSTNSQKIIRGHTTLHGTHPLLLRR